jgi:hypothetical protein
MGEFEREASRLGSKKFVGYPWTVKQSVLSDGACTTKVYDCTVCGFTDGEDVLLLHICPTHPKNKNFAQLEQYISNRIDLFNKNLQGFILGSKSFNINSPRSTSLFDYFVKLMEKYKIPFSMFKGGPFENNVAYSSKKDEWLISNPSIHYGLKQIPPKSIFNTIFSEIKVAKTDEIGW